MERYLLALEAFESETHDIYADYLMGQMIATEGFKENVGARVKQGWEALKRLGLQVWEWIKKAGRAIKSVTSRIISVFRDSDDDIEISRMNQKAKYYEQAAADIADLNATLTVDNAELQRNLEKTMAEVDRIMQSGESAAEIAEQLTSITDDLFAKHNDAMNRYNTEHKRRMDEIHKLEDELDAEIERIRSSDTIPEHKKAAAIADAGNRILDKGKRQGSFDSYLESAMEADHGTHKINISSLKKKFQHNVEAASNGIEQNEKLIARINKWIDQVKSKAQDDENVEATTKLQRILSKILRVASEIGKFFASIPGQVQHIFSVIMKCRVKKTRVKDYDGPAPEIG